MAYRKVTYRLPAEHEEAFAAALWTAGPLGLELRPAGDDSIEVDLYLAAAAPAPALDGWAERGVREVADEALEDRDWLAEYRAQATPFDLGTRFRVDPRDFDGSTAAADDRFLLRIPASTAFGTGSHESTRLALELLERLEPRKLRGATVLDVGTGSGILAFAALRLGAARAVGIDLDLPSVVEARRNARRNGFVEEEGRPRAALTEGRPRVAPTMVAARPGALAPRPRFDVAVVNVLPARIAGDLPRIAAMLRRDGRAISSGNLERERETVLARWRACGLLPVDELRDGEWVAWTLAPEALS